MLVLSRKAQESVAVADSGGHSRLMHSRRLRRGDLVRVKEGTLAGIEGTVARRHAWRVVVDVALIQSGVSLELDEHLLEPIACLNRIASPSAALV